MRGRERRNLCTGWSAAKRQQTLAILTQVRSALCSLHCGNLTPQNSFKSVHVFTYVTYINTVFSRNL